MLVLFLFALMGCERQKEINTIDAQKEININDTQKGKNTINSQKEVDAIYIKLPSGGDVCITDTYPIYRIDLANKSVSLSMVTYEEFDYNYDEIEHTWTKELTDEKIEDFVIKCAEYGFVNWNEEYDDPDVCDGASWYIDIAFTDGTTKKMSGYSEFPETWDKMGEALAELTGEEILYKAYK